MVHTAVHIEHPYTNLHAACKGEIQITDHLLSYNMLLYQQLCILGN